MQEGSRYRFGEIHFRSSYPELERRLRSFVRSGDSADLELLELAKENLTAQHHDQGFLDFRFEYMYHPDEAAHKVLLILHLEKGEPYRVGSAVYPSSHPEWRVLDGLEGRQFRERLLDHYLAEAELGRGDIELFSHRDKGLVDIIAGPPAFRAAQLRARNPASSSEAQVEALRGIAAHYLNAQGEK